MIKYTILSLLKNKLILVWPIIALLFFFVVLVFGSIQIISDSNFQIIFGTLEIKGEFFFSQVVTLVCFICVVALPNELCQMLEPKRAILIFSKPISRYSFIYNNIAGVSIVVISFTVFTFLLIWFLFFIKTGLNYNTLFIILISIPLAILTLYTTIVFLAILTNQYAISVFGAIIINLVISPLLMVIPELFEDPHESLSSYLYIINVIQYLIPNTVAVFDLNNLTYIDYSSLSESIRKTIVELFKILISCTPLLLLSFYNIKKKEF